MNYKAILMFVVAATIFAAIAQGQDASTASINSKSDALASATATCSYSFTVPGKLNSFLSFCVTVNGNIASLQSPNGFDYIAQGGVGEGYGICDKSTGTSYYDYAFNDSGTWGSPVLVSLTSTAVKIARTTTDGLWTLTQTITKQAGGRPYAKVMMALKNNSGISKAVNLIRYADVDPANAPFTTVDFTESFDSDQYSAWGYEPMNNPAGQPRLGLMLKEIGQPNVPYGFQGIDQFADGPTNVCSITNFNYVGSADLSILMLWNLTIGALKTGTVNAAYEPF